MKRTTVSLPDDLGSALDRFRRDQDVRVPVSATVQAALQEYLARRGYLTASGARRFGITPARRGSGAEDVSANHDRYLAEAAER